MSSYSHHTDHIVIANSHDRHDPVPRLAPFSGRVATAIEGQGTTTAHQLGPLLQLNVEGFTAAKKQVVEQLARNNKGLRPTPVDQLPVLAEIAPPALRREAATLVLGRRACQHDHLLHDVMENSNHRKRLKSRRPLTHHAQQLLSSVSPQETVKHRTRARWAESWASTNTRLHKSLPTPSNSGQGVGLSRRAWTRLNRLRTGVGRFGANMLRWGLSTSDCCDCGAEQTADHITSGLCHIHRPPEGIHGLIELDVKTRTWLENCALDV